MTMSQHIDKEVIKKIKAARQQSEQNIRKQFAADLKARIEISAMSPGIATPFPVIELKEIYRLIDETLNAI